MANRHIFKGVKKNSLADSARSHDQRDAFTGTWAIVESVAEFPDPVITADEERWRGTERGLEGVSGGAHASEPKRVACELL